MNQVLLSLGHYRTFMASSPNSISKLKIPTLAKKFIQEKWGISELYPPQKEALKPVLKGENTLISIPTASGKSLIAYLGIIQNLLIKNVGSKAVYIVPLKALAGEKSTMYDPCPGALQKYCKKVKLRRFAACRKCFDATRND